MCTGRVDLAFVTRALARGADGVFVGGCWPGECHYVTEGNYDALGTIYLARLLLERSGIDPARLRLEWVAASEGSRFAEVMDDFVRTLRGLGPIGSSEGLDAAALRRNLTAVDRLVPFVKLVEREKLRAPVRTEQAVRDYYDSAETRRLFDAAIATRLTTAQILALLEGGPLATAEIAEALRLDPSRIAKHMNTTARQGLVHYDVEQMRYALA